VYPKVSLQDRLDSLEKLKNACFNVVSTAAPFVAAGPFLRSEKGSTTGAFGANEIERLLLGRVPRGRQLIF